MTCVLKDLIEVSKDGEWGKGESFDDSVEMLCIRGTDFEDVRFGDANSTPRRHIAKKHSERKMLQPWDLIIEAAGGTKNQITGRTVLLRPQLFSNSKFPITCASFSRFIRLKTDLCDPQFMFWYLQHLYYAGFMHAYHTQHTGVARFQWTTFSEREPFELPSLSVQQRIAGILSAYDELIENNRRQIRILDAMASGLYQEWFVQFRFPGRDNSPTVGSSHGDIPQDWEVADLESVCIEPNGIQTGPFGSQLHEADYSDEGVPVVMPTNLIGFRIRTDGIARIPEATADKLCRHRMQPGDIVYGRRGDIGRRAYLMPHQAGWFCGTGCLRIRPNSQAVNGWYLFNYLGQDNVLGIIAGRAQGVTMPNLNTGVMASVPVKLPPRKLQDDFARLTLPMSEAHEALTAKTENLRRTRDLLLPRLLSGLLNMETN